MARDEREDSVGKVSKHRVLVAGIFSPLLALVLNIVLIQTLLALSSNPENNWRFRLFISSLALPVPFLATLVLALKDRRHGASFSFREDRFGDRGTFNATYREACDGRARPFETVTQHGDA